MIVDMHLCFFFSVKIAVAVVQFQQEKGSNKPYAQVYAANDKDQKPKKILSMRLNKEQPYWTIN